MTASTLAQKIGVAARFRFQHLSRYARLKLEGWHTVLHSDVYQPVLRHRLRGYRSLSGRGLELGAFNNPASLPRSCRVSYGDAMTAEQGKATFPEIDASHLVRVDHVCNLDKEGLRLFRDSELDFVILNHVLEHVANPLFVLSEVFRVVRPKGWVVLSIPDRDYTFDRPRSLTSFEHLMKEYEAAVTEVSDEHYLDFIRAFYPEVARRGGSELDKALARFRERRDHAHVWTSKSFSDFLHRGLNEVLRLKAAPCLEIFAGGGRFEYFASWQKAEDKALH